MDPNNFMFDIEHVTYVMRHGCLSATKPDRGASITTEFDESDNGNDEVYLLARAYVTLLEDKSG